MGGEWDFCSCPGQQVLRERQGPWGLLGGNSGPDVSFWGHLCGQPEPEMPGPREDAVTVCLA